MEPTTKQEWEIEREDLHRSIQDFNKKVDELNGIIDSQIKAILALKEELKFAKESTVKP